MSSSVVVIIGGGISGLAAAHEVMRRHPEIDLVVLEEESRPGGTLATEEIDGYLCERAASAFLDHPKGGAPYLAHALGVEIVMANQAARRRWVWRHGRLRLAPMSPPDLWHSDLLSWRGKLRLLMEPFVRTDGRKIGTKERKEVEEGMDGKEDRQDRQ
ncbi:MAG: NAD(P)-binding protein, partial [Pseudomonadota bacterium]